jgi:hypothetical protein
MKYLFNPNKIKMEKVKFGRKEYFKPTPKSIRKIGDSLLAVGLMVSAMPVFMTITPWIPSAVCIVCVIGKFISNFYAENKEHTEQD